MSSWLASGWAKGDEPAPQQALAQQRAAPPVDPSSCFTAEFAGEGKLGLHLLRTTAQRLFTVEFLSETGLAVSEPRITPGCVIVAVQGEALDGLTYDEGLERVRLAGRPVRLTFEPPAPEPGPPPPAVASTVVPPLAFEEQQDLGLVVALGSAAEDALVDELTAALASDPGGRFDIDEPEFWVRACLRSRKFHVAESALLLRKYTTWREERDVSTLGGDRLY